ncbi:hypothetical protein V5799_027460 [Amblyomma americanum]|uniref:Peritrophic membrane chitin binding protein n=1 Tax=Amblyomma americanum TaxID=6943 RepID=A0AAQ4DFN2_AMBAM
MPQFVMLTFDDAVNEQNMDFYRELLAPGRRRNRANGCNVAATFFVSAGYTDYSFVHELHSAGSEIALHSITHHNSLIYWRALDMAGWEAEFVGERHLMRDYALIPERDMVGARAPYLEIGLGDGYTMMRKHGFLYDSSVVLDYIRKPSKLPFFPYTLDYGLQTDCGVESCPGGRHRGMWLVPLNTFYMTARRDDGSRVQQSACAMPDACAPMPSTAEDTADYLRSNFESFYHTNRAPFPVFIHSTWLSDRERRRGYLSFVDWLLTKDDVFVVTVEEVVRFMRNPKPLGEYAQAKCSRATYFRRCPEIHTCPFPDASNVQTKFLVGCKPCPDKYPWLQEDTVRAAKMERSNTDAAEQSFSATYVFLCCSVLVVCACVLVTRLLRRRKVHHF